MGFLLTATMGKLFTMTLGIQLTISKVRGLLEKTPHNASHVGSRPIIFRYPLARDFDTVYDQFEKMYRKVGEEIWIIDGEQRAFFPELGPTAQCIGRKAESRKNPWRF